MNRYTSVLSAIAVVWALTLLPVLAAGSEEVEEQGPGVADYIVEVIAAERKVVRVAGDGADSVTVAQVSRALIGDNSGVSIIVSTTTTTSRLDSSLVITRFWVANRPRMVFPSE